MRGGARTARGSIRRAVVVAGAAALALFGAAPARASDPISVAMALTSAAQHASPWEPAGFSSFRMTYRWPRGKMSGIADFGHDKLKFVLPDGTVGYTAGSVVYLPDESQGWLKMIPAHVAKSLPKSVWSKTRTAPPDAARRDLADRNVNGVRMGVYQFKTHVEGDDGHLHPGKYVTMTCLYEKPTGYLRSCTSGREYVMTYDHYDDPANDFTIPAAALHAREMVYPKVP
jgi:hypothetical protein